MNNGLALNIITKMSSMGLSFINNLHMTSIFKVCENPSWVVQFMRREVIWIEF